ncbi:MAG: hypothetical protein ABIS86_06975 [Streptosporangiaceae bacterium]
MTLVLVVACLIVAAAELHLAVGRKKRDGSELEALRETLAAQAAALELTAAQGAATAARVDAILPELTTRLDSYDGILGDLSSRLDLLDDLLAAQADRLTATDDDRITLARTGRAADGLREELAFLRAQIDLSLDRLEELDAERDHDLERYRDFTQALDAVEDLVADFRSDDNEPAAATIRGGLVGDTEASHDVLTKAYEDLLDAMDLRVRMKVPEGSQTWHTQYYLAGKNSPRLQRDFAALLESRHTPQADAFHGLAAQLGEADHAFAQIGPLVIVQVPGSLSCGVLTGPESRRFDADRFVADPAAAAARLRQLPDGRFRDLTSWGQSTQQSGPDPDIQEINAS